MSSSLKIQLLFQLAEHFSSVYIILFLPKIPTVATTDSILSLCYDEHCNIK